ncbi:MAG TPA: glycosyltransferase family 4 protein [Bacteroidota bacterium]|jgi:glycosyltransferase involved in cell wall biosynthesis|nr:glycosyltransferase family 4 protein [Bacteroidota bacterium]
MTQKRVALLIPGGVGDEDSGVHIPSIVNFVKRIADRYDATVYAIISPEDIRQDYKCGNASVRYLGLSNRDSIAKKVYALASSFVRDHRSHGYDLLHGFWAFPCGLVATVMGKLFRLPSVVSILGAETANLREIAYGDMANKFVKPTTLWTCRNASAVVSLTRFQKEQLGRYDSRCKIDSIIPQTVDTGYFVKGEKTFPSPPIKIIHVANLNEVKDQETLLKTFALLSQSLDCRLRIIGKDFLSGRIQALASAMGLGDSVEFTGYVKQTDLRPQYAWADLMLVTSLHEGGGVSAAEAAASGVVVCGTEVGYIYDHANTWALASKVRDHRSLASLVIKLVENPSLYRDLQQRAHQWVLSHDVDWTVAQYETLYHQLIS